MQKLVSELTDEKIANDIILNGVLILKISLFKSHHTTFLKFV